MFQTNNIFVIWHCKYPVGGWRLVSTSAAMGSCCAPLFLQQQADAAIYWSKDVSPSAFCFLHSKTSKDLWAVTLLGKRRVKTNRKNSSRSWIPPVYYVFAVRHFYRFKSDVEFNYVKTKRVLHWPVHDFITKVPHFTELLHMSWCVPGWCRFLHVLASWASFLFRTFKMYFLFLFYVKSLQKKKMHFQSCCHWKNEPRADRGSKAWRHSAFTSSSNFIFR